MTRLVLMGSWLFYVVRFTDAGDEGSKGEQLQDVEAEKA